MFAVETEELSSLLDSCWDDRCVDDRSAEGTAIFNRLEVAPANTEERFEPIAAGASSCCISSKCSPRSTPALASAPSSEELPTEPPVLPDSVTLMLGLVPKDDSPSPPTTIGNGGG